MNPRLKKVLAYRQGTAKAMRRAMWKRGERWLHSRNISLTKRSDRAERKHDALDMDFEPYSDSVVVIEPVPTGAVSCRIKPD